MNCLKFYTTDKDLNLVPWDVHQRIYAAFPYTPQGYCNILYKIDFHKIFKLYTSKSQ